MDTQNKRIILVHHHIFKNAGTSFNFALKNAFLEQFCEFDLPDGEVVTGNILAQYLIDHSNLVALSGHHIALDIFKTNEFKILSSILIRKPLDRILSIYRFERAQEAQTEGALMAKKLNFKEFVSWRLDTTPQVFCNYQTLYCSRQGHTKNDYMVTSEDFNLACHNLDKCFAVGTVEEYDKFLLFMQYEARKYFKDKFFENTHLNISSKNKSSKKSVSTKDILVDKLGEDLVYKLIELNQSDEKLYEYANNKIRDWSSNQVEEKLEYYYSLSDTYALNEQWRDMINMLQGVVALKPLSFKLYFRLAEAYEKIEDIESAISNYEKTIIRNKKFPWSYYKLGNIYYVKNEYSKAVDFYRQAIKYHPLDKSYDFFLALGDAFLKLGQLEEAIEAYLKAESIHVHTSDLYLKLTWVYYINKNFFKANYYSTMYISSSPDKCTAYIQLGDTFKSGGSYDMARTYYSDGIKQNNNNQLCHTKLAALLKKDYSK